MKMGVGFLSAGWRTAVQVRPTIQIAPIGEKPVGAFFVATI